MSVQFSATVRNARLDAIESTIGVSAILRIYTGAVPANCAAASTGTLLAEMTLPSDWMAAAASGAKAKSGTWQDASANATGLAGYFRIFTGPGGTVCHIQGTVTETAGAGDMKIDGVTADITSGETVTVTAFDLTDANA